ncbi:MAG: hypothetical protein Q9226_009069, partial [Calogaya cf. arnoldii]
KEKRELKDENYRRFRDYDQDEIIIRRDDRDADLSRDYDREEIIIRREDRDDDNKYREREIAYLDPDYKRTDVVTRKNTDRISPLAPYPIRLKSRTSSSRRDSYTPGTGKELVVREHRSPTRGAITTAPRRAARIERNRHVVFSDNEPPRHSRNHDGSILSAPETLKFTETEDEIVNKQLALYNPELARMNLAEAAKKKSGSVSLEGNLGAEPPPPPLKRSNTIPKPMTVEDTDDESNQEVDGQANKAADVNHELSDSTG